MPPPTNDEVLACFVLDPRLEASSGERRLQFLCDSLRQLRDDLDGRLLVTRGRPEKRIPALVKEIDAPSVHVSEDFAPFGRAARRAGALGAGRCAAGGDGVAVSGVAGTRHQRRRRAVQGVHPVLRRWRDRGGAQPAKSGAKSARWVDPKQLGKHAKPVEIPDPGAELDLPAGETAARRQWKKFVDKGLENYADDRNGPDHDGTSRMSAHLKFGTIHPRTMVADLDQRRAGAQAYSAGVGLSRLLRRGAASLAGQQLVELEPRLRRDRDRHRRARPSGASKRGKPARPGFPIVDAGMRQLRETGFMHNRVRMIVASFLVKDLHLPWQWGARWFLDQLVDGDMASNQHGWQWSAGCGTDAAPYFRVFNPTTQAREVRSRRRLRAALGPRAR